MLGNPRNYFLGVGEGGGGGETRNPGIWNPLTKIWNPVQSTWNSESTEWNPEYKTALDPLPNGINRMSYQP